MNCQEFWEGYPELADSGEPHGHAAECPACARRLAAQKALTAALRAARVDWRATDAPDRVERGLVAAFRSQQARQECGRRFMWLPVLTWAAAAAVLVVLAMLTIHGSRPVVAPRHAPPAAVQWASSPAPADFSPGADSNDGDFIPLPNAEQVGDNEDVNVVRVEVPRSAMLAVGLPVNPEQASEMVEADVMLGSDGLARAVRFVNE